VVGYQASGHQIDNGRTLVRMAGGTVASSTRSLVVFADSCTQEWCLCVAKCELHVPGTTRGVSSMLTRAPFSLLCGGHYG
jgi:hypothetical protein